MKNIIFIRSLLRGGAEKQAVLLTKLLQQDQETLLLVLYKNPDAIEIDHHELLNIIFLEGNIVQKAWNFYWLLRKYKPLNLICFLPSNNILGAFTGKFVGVKNILCGIRSSKTKAKYKMTVLRFICNHMNVKFISNSFHARTQYIQHGFDERNISVIPNGIQIPAENHQIQRSIIGKPTYTLLCVGRFIMEKGFDTLIDSISILTTRNKFTNFELRIVGYGDLESNIRTRIKTLDLESKITIMNGISTNILDEYLNADLYISSSIHEGMSNTIMEAMSYKLPIISTLAGDCDQLVINGYNGFTTDIGDAEKIADLINKILTDSEKYPFLCENSFSLLKDRFSVEKYVENYKVQLIND